MKTDSCAPLARVVDLLLDAICVVDAQGNFVYASAACERIFGYTPQEMLGKRMIEMVYPEDRERTMAAARSVMADQPLLHFENRYVRKDGGVVHIMWSACWSTDNKLRIGVARDITQRKQSEAMQAALYSISEAAHGAKDLAALYQQIHQTIAQLLPVDDFIVAIRTASGELAYPYRRWRSTRLLCRRSLRRLCAFPFCMAHKRCASTPTQCVRWRSRSVTGISTPVVGCAAQL